MPDQRIRRLVALRQRFKGLHREGMAALKDHDFDTFGRVIQQEREIFKKQAALIRVHAAQLKATARRAARKRKALR